MACRTRRPRSRSRGRRASSRRTGSPPAKGVFVCHTQEELDHALQAVTALGGGVVIEELLEGPEVSVFALCDGVNAIPLPSAQDFKRAYDGDEGPNTGGMGSYSPAPELDVDEILETVHRPVLAELARRDSSFVGVLFAGLMLTENGPRVLEFNCRFGDPETQSLLPRLEGDLLEALAAAAAGDARDVELATTDDAAVTVVIAGGEYPASNDVGSPIDGIEDAEASGRDRLPRGHCSARRPRSSRAAVGSSTSRRPGRRSQPPATSRTTPRRAFPSPVRAIAPTSRRRQRLSESSPVVGILVGSESDRERMQGALDELDKRGIAYEFDVRSAHRQPDEVAEYCKTARARG